MPCRPLWTLITVCLLAGASQAEDDLHAALAGLEERLRGPAREWSKDEVQAFRSAWKAAGKSLGPEDRLRFARVTIDALHTGVTAETKSDTVLEAAFVRGQGLEPPPDLRLTDLERRLDELRRGWTPAQQAVFEGAWAEAARRLKASGEASDPGGLLPRFLRLTVEAQLLARPDALEETLLTRPARPVEAAPGGNATLQDAVKKVAGVNLRDVAQWSRRARAALERLAGDPAQHLFLGTLVGAHDARARQLAAAGHGEPPVLGAEWLQRHPRPVPRPEPRPERASTVGAGAKRDPRNDVGTVR